MVRPLTLKLLRDIRRHRAQFLAVGLTVFLGVTLFAASYDSFRNLRASYEETFTEFRFANLTIGGGDTEAIADRADAADGVASVQTRTVADVPIRIGDHKLLGRVAGTPAGEQPSVNRLKVLQGDYPGAGGGVLVEEHMAEHFDLAPGGTIEVLIGTEWRTETVAAVVSSPEYIWPARSRQDLLTSPDNFGVVFGSEELAREVAGDGPNEVTVYYDGGAANEALTESLETAARDLGATSIYTRDEQPSNAALSEDIKGFEETAMFFPVLFLAAAAMAAYVMISRLVWSQRPTIGVLVANGFTRRRILTHYLGYGLVPGLAGAIPGAVAGVLLARVITDLYTNLLSVPVTLIEFYPATLVAGVVFGLLTAVLAALAPALFASRVRPALAMRGETPARAGRVSLIERILPPLRRLPTRWRMALRGIERNPRRTAYTIIGVVLSLTLVLVSWGMIDTVEHLLDLQFLEIQREDATVHFTGPVSADEVEQLVAIDGIAAAEPVLELPASIGAGRGHYDTVLLAMETGTEMHGFRTPGGDWIELPSEGVLVGEALGDLLGIEPGDAVELAIAPLGATVPEEIAGFVTEPLGTLAYVSRDRVATLTGGPVPATAAMISYDAGVDGDDVRVAVTALPAVAAFDDAKALYDIVQDYMVLFYAFVGVMLVFGAAMAFALIFNAMSVNIAERSREIATLLAVGTRRRSISRLITVENLLVAAAGIPLGLFVGYQVSKAAMGTFSSDLFTFPLFVRTSTFLWTAAAIVIVALISQWPGLRALRRLEIAKIVKERSV